MSTFDCDQAEAFLGLLFGDRPGTVCLAFGRDPYRSRDGKYKHRSWSERDDKPRTDLYRWPAERDRLLDDVAREMATGPVDTYFCPALRHAGAKGRRKGDALPAVWLWADLDGQAKDPALLDRLGALIVRSGSDDHQHAYVALDAAALPYGGVPVAVLERLNQALAKRLGGDAKWSDESLLRLPGTANRKIDPPAPVELTGAEHRVWPLDELAELLGVDLDGQAPGGNTGSSSTAAGSGPLPSPEPAPDPLPDTVLRALNRPSTGDRSADAARVVEACAFAGLTPGEALSVLAGHPSYAHYKSGRHAAVDVDRVYRKFGPRGEPDGRKVPRDASVHLSVDRLPILPDDFWEARKSLKHIRKAAHARLASADLVLHAGLAKISAMRSHELRFDSGRPGCLNYFAAPVGASGTGKTTGAAVVDELLVIPAWFTTAKPDGADAEPFHDGIPLGSGEGIAEAFMGLRETEVGKKDDGSPIMKPVRQVVRHNAYLVLDEGEAFTRLTERSGNNTASAIRSAWSGATIGQHNGRQETTRVVKAGEYSLGMVIGLQLGTALPLLADTATGTAQRFAWVSALDPTIPDDPVDFPGHLVVDLTDGTFPNTPRSGVMAFPADVVKQLRVEHLAKVRGEVLVDEQDSQGPLMRCKMAALLALLDGRGEVSVEDWQLAGVLWETSCGVRDAVVAIGQSHAEQERAARDDARVTLAERTAAVVDVAPDRAQRLAERVAGYVHEAGGLTTGATKKKLRSGERALFDAAVTIAELRGWIAVDASGALLPGTEKSS